MSTTEHSLSARLSETSFRSAEATSCPFGLYAAFRRESAGGQHEWDRRHRWESPWRGVCTHSRIDASPLIYNQPDPVMPGLLIWWPELADQLLRTLSSEEGATV